MTQHNSLIFNTFIAITMALVSIISYPALAASPLNNNQRVSAQNAIGKVLTTQGVVVALHDKKLRQLKRGSAIYPTDMIIAKVQSNARLHFSDGSLFSLAPKTIFAVKNYRFNKTNTKKDAFTGQLMYGALRTITGTIGKRNRKKYKMIAGPNAQKPVAVIGVRGTDFTIKFTDSSNSNQYVFSQNNFTSGNAAAIQLIAILNNLNFPADKPLQLEVRTIAGITTVQTYTPNGMHLQYKVVEAGKGFSFNFRANDRRPDGTVAPITRDNVGGNSPPAISPDLNDTSQIIDTTALYHDANLQNPTGDTSVSLASGGEAIISEEEYGGETVKTISLNDEDLNALADVAELNETTSSPIHVFAIQDANNSTGSSGATLDKTINVGDDSGRRANIYLVNPP